MKEYPILFSAEMVRAILEGRKTQTRRVAIPRHDDKKPCEHWMPSNDRQFMQRHCEHGSEGHGCPYGVPGDRLWVRETWGVGCRPHPMHGWVDGIEYRADVAYLEDHDTLDLYTPKTPDAFEYDSIKPGWHPSIHMPRWASRITLEITDIRVERVRDITEEDARAEGVNTIPYMLPGENGIGLGLDSICKPRFKVLWNSINSKRGYGWDVNPYVWVIGFRRIES